MEGSYFIMCKVKCLCAYLIKHYAMKTYEGLGI
jgi:hypothetical protein